MKRIPALDSLRGLLLVLMTINHLIWLSGGRSLLQYFTLQPLGQFGAAEGFVMISGLLAGAVYSRTELPDREATGKILRRAFTIYKYHMVSLLLVMVWFSYCAFALPTVAQSLGSSFNNLGEAPLATILLSALLINKPDYLEILPLYVIFMLILPIALYAFRRGLMWLVLAISVGVWAVSTQINASLLSSLFETNVQVGYFDPFAWQLLFIGGAAIGFSNAKGKLRWYHPAAATVCLAIAALLFAAHHGAFLSMGIHQGVLYSFADKPELGWLRMLNLMVWVYLVATVIRKWPSALVFRPLSYIGKNSLQVFTWHAVLIYFTAPFLSETVLSGYFTLLVLLLTATLWMSSWLQECRKQAGKTLIPVTALASVFVVVLSASLISKQPKEVPTFAQGESYPLTIKITDIRVEEAGVVVLVYSETDNLMGGAPTAHANHYTSDEAREGITLEALPSGFYGIMAYQDVDGNNTLSFGANGIPSEGFGFSNNPAPQGPPSMALIKFAHHEAQDQTIHLLNLY
ncbi:OpgC protein [Grimontia indica]|uniref:OpgC protein n=1 Tax=Grimontia indica TaxID=1056512 RepID=R1IX11_9GAMM|nr:OpgC domain-containing protein [Grimontia indica]EOD79835.1 OpgC protein [Grimontia indica]